MSISFARLPDLAIPVNTKPSNALTALDLEDAVAILLIAPDSLDGNTYTIQVRRRAAATWVTLQAGAIGNALADVAPPAAGKSFCYDSLVYGLPAFHSFRINSSVNVGDALHVWEAIKLWKGM